MLLKNFHKFTANSTLNLKFSRFFKNLPIKSIDEENKSSW